MHLSHTILLIDDDPDDREMFEEALNEGYAKHDIIQAEDGFDGIEKLHHLLKTNELPCLIILDLNMPKLDGKQTFLSIKDDTRFFKIPVVVLSTSVSDADKAFFQREGVHYITKPINFEHLSRVAGQLMSYCEKRVKDNS